MDIRFIGNSQEKLKKLLDKEHSEEHNNYVELQKKRKEHIEKYHFKDITDIITYLKNGGKLLKDMSYKDEYETYIIYNNDTDKVEIYKKDGCGEIEWSYNSMSIKEFEEKYFFTFIKYDGYIQKWHREL